MTKKSHDDDAVFGPVPSRRLGLSLGVDLLTHKVCSLDCVYCECGPTTRLTTERGRFRDLADVLSQVERRLAELERPPDYVTLAGSGEPCLSLDLGTAIARLKAMGPHKVAVLTNATLVGDAAVRAELALADLLVPSLDAVSPAAFRRVNRPAAGLDPQAIIEGLALLRREMAGQMWLEILLAGGYNDSPEELALLLAAVARINPHKVQLGTVVRPPALAGVKPVAPEVLGRLAGALTTPVEVIPPPRGAAGLDKGDLGSRLVEMTRRRPCTVADAAAAAGLAEERARELLDGLVGAGLATVSRYDGRAYYRGV